MIEVCWIPFFIDDFIDNMEQYFHYLDSISSHFFII